MLHIYLVYKWYILPVWVIIICYRPPTSYKNLKKCVVVLIASQGCVCFPNEISVIVLKNGGMLGARGTLLEQGGPLPLKIPSLK